MSRKVQFVTPENIEVTYELAGIGSRFLAAFIDQILQLAIILIVLLIGHFASNLFSITSIFGGNAPKWVDAILILMTFAIIFGYHTAFELMGAGRTPGKKVAGLRVVRDGGYPIDPYASIIRNLVRIVDLLPPIYGIGLASVFFSSDYKRLGDYAAGTIVIKERPPNVVDAPVANFSSPMAAQFMPHIPRLDALTPAEYQVIHRFAARRHELDITTQTHLAMQIALPLMSRLGITMAIPVQWHYADLLEAIDRKYIQERGILTQSDFLAPPK
jgi:uncharacterized RDD family membrane protein YckC